MMSSDAAYAALLRRLDRLFSGDDPGPEERVRAAAVVSVLAGASVHHLVHELDDDTLRAQLAVVIAQLSLAPAAQVQ
jgi:hypothetical protein